VRRAGETGIKSAARDLGAFICFEDEAGQGAEAARRPYLGPARDPAGSEGPRRGRRAGQHRRGGVLLVWCWDNLNIHLAPELAEFAAENKE